MKIPTLEQLKKKGNALTLIIMLKKKPKNKLVGK